MLAASLMRVSRSCFSRLLTLSPILPKAVPSNALLFIMVILPRFSIALYTSSILDRLPKDKGAILCAASCSLRLLISVWICPCIRTESGVAAIAAVTPNCPPSALTVPFSCGLRYKSTSLFTFSKELVKSLIVFSNSFIVALRLSFEIIESTHCLNCLPACLYDLIPVFSRSSAIASAAALKSITPSSRPPRNLPDSNSPTV